MKHPLRSDFHTVVTEEGVSVTFKPTNSVYGFDRLADDSNIGGLGLISFVGIQHAGHNTEDYRPDEVQDMARSIASELVGSVWFQERNPLPPANVRHTGPSGKTKARLRRRVWRQKSCDPLVNSKSR
jgi:hypothetical protein